MKFTFYGGAKAIGVMRKKINPEIGKGWCGTCGFSSTMKV